MIISKLRGRHLRHCWRWCRKPFCFKDVRPENCPDGYLPLAMVAPGASVKLVEIAAGHRLRRRLTELGLVPGIELKVIKDGGGPLLLAVQDTRLALGRRMAYRILVQVV